MKNKDLASIILIVGVSALISFFASNALFNKSEKNKEQVEVVQAIKSEFITPDKKYFNGNSINPTRQITIGDTNNPDPFRGN